MKIKKNVLYLSEDVARLWLGEGAAPRDVVEQVLARCRSFEHHQEAVGLLEVVDEMDHAVHVRQPLKDRHFRRHQPTRHLHQSVAEHTG